jgi:hypothetical protein
MNGFLVCREVKNEKKIGKHAGGAPPPHYRMMNVQDGATSSYTPDVAIDL